MFCIQYLFEVPATKYTMHTGGQVESYHVNNSILLEKMCVREDTLNAF